MKYYFITLLTLICIIWITACGGISPTPTMQTDETQVNETQVSEIKTTTATVAVQNQQNLPTQTVIQPTPTTTSTNFEVYMAKNNEFKIDFPDTWEVEKIPEFVVASHPDKLAQIYILSPGSKIKQNINSAARKEILNTLWAVGISGIPEFKSMEVERHKITTHFILNDLRQKEQVLYQGQLIERWNKGRDSVMIIALLAPKSPPALNTVFKQSIDSFSFSDTTTITQLPSNSKNTQAETVAFYTYTQPDGLFEIDLPLDWFHENETKEQALIISHPTNTAHILIEASEILDLGPKDEKSLRFLGDGLLNTYLFDVGILGLPEITKHQMQSNKIIIDFNLIIEEKQILYQGQLTMQWLTEEGPAAILIAVAKPESDLFHLLKQSMDTFTLNAITP